MTSVNITHHLLIARDYWGWVIMARSITKLVIVDPTTVESMAALQGILLGQELETNGIIFEGDAQQVVREVNS